MVMNECKRLRVQLRSLFGQVELGAGADEEGIFTMKDGVLIQASAASTAGQASATLPYRSITPLGSLQ